MSWVDFIVLFTLPLYLSFILMIKCRAESTVDQSCSGIAHEAPVHYFELGTEKWKTSQVWPLKPSSWLDFFMSDGNKLLASNDGNFAIIATSTSNISCIVVEDTQELQNVNGSESYTVVNATTSGLSSRWNLVQHILRRPFEYIVDKRRKLFTSGVLSKTETLVIGGSCRVRLCLCLHGGTDAAVFAYLEDIDMVSGKTRYITEGMLRASRSGTTDACHTSKPLANLPLWSPFERTYTRNDLMSFNEGEAITFDIHLEPVSYALHPGHAIRLSLSGSDVGNFCTTDIDDLATSWEFKYAKSNHDVDKWHEFCCLSLPIF